MNWNKIKSLVNNIKKNIECGLHDGQPCGTCTYALIRDIQKLNDLAVDYEK